MFSASVSMLLGVGILLAVVTLIFSRKSGQLPLPRGPRRLPFIGNLHQMTDNAGAFFASLGERYGPIAYLSLAGQDVIVLNTLTAANEILDKRGMRYPSRPRFIFAGKYVSSDRRAVLSPWNDVFKRQRGAITRYWSPPTVRAMAQRQLDEASVTVAHLLGLNNGDPMANGPKLITEIKRFSASIVTQTTYGWRCVTGTEKDLLDLRRVVGEFEECAAPGAHLVDTLPFLDLLPDFIAAWRKLARAQQRRNVELFGRLANDVKQRMEHGDEKAIDSFAGRLWQEQSKYGMDDLDIAFFAGNMYEAAARHQHDSTDTTAATLATFFLAICIHPNVQEKAQQELDHVCKHRSPTWSDLASLPYICAIVKEALRWRSPLPTGVPHKGIFDEDDEYQGMRIPTRAIVFANTSGIHLDENEYGPFPELFIPERWLEQENLSTKLTDLSEGHISFGVGRRYCPGHGQAVQSLFVCIANVLHKLTVRPLEGHYYDPDAFPTTFVCAPRPFPVSFAARPGYEQDILYDAEVALGRLSE